MTGVQTCALPISSGPPPDRTPPSIQPGRHVISLAQQNMGCGSPTTLTISATVADASGVASVWFVYHVATKIPFDGTVTMSAKPPTWFGTLGPFPFDWSNADGGPITVTIHARDNAGNEGTAVISDITLLKCNPIV